MLRDFLEPDIQNKLNIFFMLSARDSVSISEFCETLEISKDYTLALLDELRADLPEDAVIERCRGRYSIDMDKNESIGSMHAIYRNSNVLECLRFMIAGESQKPFSCFISETSLKESAAYRIRETCITYLRSVGLDFSKKGVTGDEYRIRFLIALLHYEYGIDCIEFDPDSVKLVRDFVLRTNQAVPREFLEQTSHEYGFFESLMILAWKRRRYPVPLPPSDEMTALKGLFVYDAMKTALKASIEPALKMNFSDDDYNYIYLVYCCTNSCVFASQWTVERVNDVHRFIFSRTGFSELLSGFGNVFGTKLTDKLAFRSALVYLFKKCLLGLQCLIPDEHVYLDCKFDAPTLKIANMIREIFDSWTNTVIDNGYTLDETHLLYLSIQLKSILRQTLPPVDVIIVSDIISELSDMNFFLTRNFSPDLINVTPYLLNAQNPPELLNRRDCVVITNRKFRNILLSLGFGRENKIVPITIEINNDDVRMTGEAVMEIENRKFASLLDGY